MNDLFISEKNISLQKKSTTQVNAQCTLEIQLVQCLNLMTLKKESASVASSTNEEKKEEVATEGKYDVTNNTGKEVKELYFYDATGTDKGENYAKDGLADGATVTVNVNVDEDKAEGYAMKVEYVTEDGDDVVVFESLHLEEAPMYLKSADDVKSGATPFSKPE